MWNLSAKFANALLGMISFKKSLIPVFGHKHIILTVDPRVDVKNDDT